MSQTLHILMLEDSPLDAELTLSKLAESEFRFDATRIDTQQSLLEQIPREDLDLILSDYRLPSFSGLEALKIARTQRPDLPFIFVSGALGEDNAVEMLKEGATDYVLKQRLDRLVPSVRRAIAESRERTERKRVEEALRIERKRAEEEREALLLREQIARGEAERASQMKDQFLATLSHELRTPLNAIVGWAEILRSDRTTAEDLAEGLAVIERNARVQARIIDDLLDMSRINSGKLRLDVQWVDLAEVILAALESVHPSADAKGIKIQKVLDPLAGPLRGDPGRLQQVVWNLLTNAIKFTPRGGKVQVSLEKIESHLCITVSDTGSGIEPAFLPHIFDRFRQADASTTRSHGGLGLGLSIVKQLVEMHGGAVRASSDGLDRGATFTVMIPVPVLQGDAARRIETLPPKSRRSSRDESPQLKGVRVLTVDDEPDARLLLRRILEDCGAEVLTAGSADQALEVVMKQPLNVLVSDIGMPGRDGYELLRQIRALPPEQGGVVPAIALTAFARSEDRRRAMTAGFDMHVSKPVDPAELCAMVARLAGKLVTPIR
jgi:signal transduction histidine kinase